MKRRNLYRYKNIASITDDSPVYLYQIGLGPDCVKQQAQQPQRNSASAAHVYLGWLTDRAMHRTPQNRRRCTIRL